MSLLLTEGEVKNLPTAIAERRQSMLDWILEDIEKNGQPPAKMQRAEELDIDVGFDTMLGLMAIHEELYRQCGWTKPRTNPPKKVRKRRKKRRR